MPYKLADTSGHGHFLNQFFGGAKVVAFSPRQDFARASGIAAPQQRLSNSFGIGELRTAAL